MGEVEPIHFREYLGKTPVHTLIIVCDGAAKACPAVWPGAQQRLFWPFDDPAAVEGSEEALDDDEAEVVQGWLVPFESWDCLRRMATR